jgi:SagB-type dehydrogenase family enzyme
MPWESGAAALRYHEETKHSPYSVRAVPHFLDWENQPLPFKIYEGVESTPLPAVSAIGAHDGAGDGVLDVSSLSKLLFYTAGITKRLRLRGGSEMPFRAAACTGALYHVEIYVASGPLDGLEPGLFHYDPRAHALDRLRSGDFRSHLAEAAAGEHHVDNAAATLVLTTTYWRNAWKYRARAYRHAFWDSGTMLANLFAMGASLSIPARLVMGFTDDDVHRLIGVDPNRESAVALVSLGRSATRAEREAEPVPPLELATVPLSREEVDYPAIRDVQRASSLGNADDVRQWREGGEPIRTEHGGAPDLRALEPEAAGEASIERVIRKRGSSRQFSRGPIDYSHLSTMLAAATRGTSADCLPGEGTLSDPYLIANDVRGLPAGSYAFHPETLGLETLREGDLRSQAGFLDLDQSLAADASANVYFLVNLEPLFERYGARGYRVAQIEGGILGGRIYLAAYALGLGATGLTFYDDAVTEFFSPHAAGKAVMFLVAVGVPASARL